MIRSRETKLPMHAASSRSIQAMKVRGSRWLRAATITNGNRTAARRTRKTEMPSTPRYHEMPSDCAQTWFETN